MPNINLIAVRRAEKKRLETNTRRLFFGLTGEIAVLVLLGSLIGARQWQLRDALSEANAQITKLQPVLDRIDQIQKETKALQPKVETLEAAKTDTLRWRAMLQIVSQSIPNSAWLSGITSATLNDETTITITGLAGSQTLVGETMTRLGAYPVFDKVELRFTQLASTPLDSAPRISFEIGAHLASTRPAEKAPAQPGGPASSEKAAKNDEQGAQQSTAVPSQTTSGEGGRDGNA